jgi:SNF2 family DNA or RNA helicase
MLLRKLRDYQLEAVQKARPHPGFAFFLEQRTGKCLCSLALVEERRPAFLFIVTTLKGKRVWHEEIKKSIKFDWDCVVFVIHYEDLHKNRAYFRKKFREWGDNVFIICDESHKIKRRGSRPARVVRSLGKLARWRLALTGTPLAPRSRTKRRKRTGPQVTVTEGLEDAWAQFDFINPRIFGTKDEFDATYLKMGGFRGFSVVGYQNKEKFYELFHRYSYRKLLREVQTRKTLIRRSRIRFDLSPPTRKAYDSMDKKLYAVVENRQITIPLLISRLTKLQQLSSGFIIDSEADEVLTVGDDKLQALKKLLKTIFSRGHGKKIVICAKFINEIKGIENICRRVGLRYQVVSGGLEFRGEFEVPITILQIQSGVAIDLANATAFIFYSMGHNYIDYEQARFRVLSFDQRRVDFYYLLANNTIDELVYEAQTGKKSLATLVLDHYRRQYEQSFQTGVQRRALRNRTTG